MMMWLTGSKWATELALVATTDLKPYVLIDIKIMLTDRQAYSAWKQTYSAFRQAYSACKLFFFQYSEITFCDSFPYVYISVQVPPFILSQVRSQYQHESMRSKDSKPVRGHRFLLLLIDLSGSELWTWIMWRLL